MAQRTNKKPANTKTKRTQAAKKNTQTKTRAAARKPRDQEVHKQRNQIVAILLFAWDVWYVSKEKALGHGCIMRF